MHVIREMIGCKRMDEVLRRAEDRTVWHSIAAHINLRTLIQHCGKVSYFAIKVCEAELYALLYLTISDLEL